MVEPPEGRLLYPSYCETFKLSTYSAEYFYDFGLDLFNNELLPGEPNKAFQFYAQAYDGTEYANGINCNVFLSCEYNQRLGANFSAAYYFSSNPNFHLEICHFLYW